MNRMKIICNYFLMMFFTFSASHSLSQEKDEYIDFGASYVGDFSSNYSGGIEKGSTYLGMIDITLSLSTEKAGLWKNGQFFGQIENTHGGTPSSDFMGDLQVVSNIENGNYTYLYQIWYQHKINSFSILAGVHDLNADFVANDYCSVFINSSFGIMPNVSMNVPVPIFPKNALGLVMEYNFSQQLKVKTALYDGNPGSLEKDPYNMDLTVSKKQGYISINEVTLNKSKDDKQIGIYTLGGYYHSATAYNLADSAQQYNGNYGFYFIGSHCLYSEDEKQNQGLNLFTQVGWAPSNRNFSDYYAGIGINYKGLITSRDKDVMGIAIGHLSLSNMYLNATNNNLFSFETVIELTYSWQVTENITIQPDIQYVINPGANKNYNNAFASIVRTSINF